MKILYFVCLTLDTIHLFLSLSLCIDGIQLNKRTLHLWKCNVQIQFEMTGMPMVIDGATMRKPSEPPGSEYVKHDTLFILFTLSSKFVFSSSFSSFGLRFYLFLKR